MTKKFFNVKFYVIFDKKRKATFVFDNIEADNVAQAHRKAFDLFTKNTTYDCAIILKRQKCKTI